MDGERLRLRADEALVFQALTKKEGTIDLASLSKELEMTESSLAPLVHSLASRGLIRVRESEITSASLTVEGAHYAQTELPERRLLKTVLGSGGRALLAAALSLSNLTAQEASIALGWARKKGWIRLEKGPF